MAEKGKPGDVVRLAKGEGIFVDYETGFEVFNQNTGKLGEKVGERTQQALLSGGLVIVRPEKKKAAKTEEKTDEK